MVRPRTAVPAPPVTPLPYGLLSAALVLDDLDGHIALGYHYEPEACGTAHTTRAACEAEAAAFSEVTEGVPLIEGDPFTLYSLFQCRPVGVDLQARAVATLRVGEQRGVEAAVAERLPLAVGAVDLSPDVVVHPAQGLAMLEGFAAANYGGVPTVHVTRTTGSILGSIGAITRSANGARLESVQGSLIASGGGYEGMAGPPTDAADPETVQDAGDGTAWAYVTGQVVVRRSPRTDATPLVMNRAPGAATNDLLVLAHRPYGVTWECVTAAVRVSTHYLGAMIVGVEAG